LRDERTFLKWREKRKSPINLRNADKSPMEHSKKTPHNVMSGADGKSFLKMRGVQYMSTREWYEMDHVERREVRCNAHSQCHHLVVVSSPRKFKPNSMGVKGGLTFSCPCRTDKDPIDEIVVSKDEYCDDEDYWLELAFALGKILIVTEQ
jgi:hypothetical protein